MSNQDEIQPVSLNTPAEQYRIDLERQMLGNALALIEQRLNQVISALPDRASVEVTKENITTIMEAMVRVASKENMIVISDRLGRVEALAEKATLSSSLNEKDVSQLKEGQAALRDAIYREVERVNSGVQQQTSSLGTSIKQQTDEVKGELHTRATALTDELNTQTKELKDSLELKAANLKSDLDTQTKELKKELTDQTKELLKQIADLKLDVEKSRSSNAIWLLGTILVIIGAVVAASTFFYRTVPERGNASTVTQTQPQPATPAAKPGP